MHELKELAIISAYLYVTLGAVIMMKTAVLHTEGIAFAPWGIAIVKAVVLGKFVLLGNAVHVGGRNISGPLIWPTLRRAFAFLVLLVVLTIIEEVVVGLFHHQSIAASLGELFGARLQVLANDRRLLPVRYPNNAVWGHRHLTHTHPASMFVVTEAEAAAIRAVYEQRGEFSAAVELRHGGCAACAIEVAC